MRTRSANRRRRSWLATTMHDPRRPWRAGARAPWRCGLRLVARRSSPASRRLITAGGPMHSCAVPMMCRMRSVASSVSRASARHHEPCTAAAAARPRAATARATFSVIVSSAIGAITAAGSQAAPGALTRRTAQARAAETRDRRNQTASSESSVTCSCGAATTTTSSWGHSVNDMAASGAVAPVVEVGSLRQRVVARSSSYQSGTTREHVAGFDHQGIVRCDHQLILPTRRRPRLEERYRTGATSEAVIVENASWFAGERARRRGRCWSPHEVRALGGCSPPGRLIEQRIEVDRRVADAPASCRRPTHVPSASC